MSRFVSKCIAEFGATAPLALRSGNAPSSELHARVCGEYSVAYVDGEFDPAGGVGHARHVRHRNRGPTNAPGGRRRSGGDEPRPEKTTLACIPDALLARIANLAIDDLRIARARYPTRRRRTQPLVGGARPFKVGAYSV
jgi:hypothetical protein